MADVEVRGKYLLGDDSPARGDVTFAPRVAAANDGGDGNILIGRRVRVTLDAAGEFAVTLQASDDPLLDPTGWTYQVVEELSGVAGRWYDIVIPTSAAVVGIDLWTVAPAPASAGEAGVTLTAFTALTARVTTIEDDGPYDPAGSAAASQALALLKAQNLADLPSPGAARTNLGLGTAAVENAGDFDAAGMAAAAQSAAVAAAAIDATTKANAAQTAAIAAAGVLDAGLNLSSLGLSGATADIRVLLDAAVAAGARKIVVPYRSTPWPMLTAWTASNVWLDFEPGARISFNMTSRAMTLTNVKLTRASFTSTYTGPASIADATDPAAYEFPARQVTLNDHCTVEDYYQEYATGGLDISGAHVRFRNVRFKNMRHRRGWASCVHAHGAGAYDILGWGVFAEDTDRGIETEDGARDVNVHGGHLKNVYPNGYTGSGSAPSYETYTFVLDAHAHAASGGVANIRYSGEWRLENCGAGVTFIRSSGADDADLPRNCSVENVRFIGRSMAAGAETILIEGHNNSVENFSFELGAGITGTLFRAHVRAGTGNRLGAGRAETFSLPLVTVAAAAVGTKVGQIDPLDAVANGTGWLYDIAGPGTELDGIAAPAIGGTLGYLRLQATATESRVRSFAYTLKAGETFANAVSDLSGNSAVSIQAGSPLLATALRAGKFLSLPNRAITTAAALSNGTLRTVPVYLPVPVTIDQLGTEVTIVGDVGCVLRLGIYTDAGGLPGVVLADVTVPGDAVAIPMANLPAPLKLAAGWYHVGGVLQGVTVTQPTVRVTLTAADGFLIFSPATSGVAPVGYSKGGLTAGALPAYGTTISTTNIAPRVWARVA